MSLRTYEEVAINLLSTFNLIEYQTTLNAMLLSPSNQDMQSENDAYIEFLTVRLNAVNAELESRSAADMLTEEKD